jgi:hypothetical protein
MSYKTLIHMNFVSVYLWYLRAVIVPTSASD